MKILSIIVVISMFLVSCSFINMKILGRELHDNQYCPAQDQYITELQNAGHEQMESTGKQYLRGNFEMIMIHYNCYSDKFFKRNGYIKSDKQTVINEFDETLYYQVWINCEEITAFTIVTFEGNDESFGMIYEVIHPDIKKDVDFFDVCDTD